MTHADINDLPTKDYIFKIGDRGKGIQARYDENTDALIFSRAAFDYVFSLVKERLESEDAIRDEMEHRREIYESEADGLDRFYHMACAMGEAIKIIDKQRSVPNDRERI